MDQKSPPPFPAQPQHHHRQKHHRKNRRFVLFSLALILLFTIPLCFFVFFEPPKIIVFWLADDYDGQQDSMTTDSPKAEFLKKMGAGFGKTDENKKPDNADLPKVLLISYDGFKWDYIQKNNATPTFRWLIANGVFATEGLKNTYITITAPNHYALVTGLYEESHGIVANEFLAPEYNETIDYFNQRTQTDPRVFGGEPIWVTNDKMGGGRSTGCQMWTGCDVVIKGRLPAHFTSWDGDLSWIIRVDSIINWFKDPVEPINMGLLYIEEPDETGHGYGPDDPKTAAMVQKLDQLTAYLLWRLHQENLLDKVNLIFTADHGMAAVPYANVVNLDQYVNRSLYTVYGGTPNWNVLPVPGHEQEIYDALYNKVPHLFVYNKTANSSTIPPEYHYTNTPHVLPLQFVADLHWRLSHNDTITSEKNGKPIIYERKTRGKILRRELEISNATVGEHGYNNSLTDMHPYFIGFGPAFKKGFNISQFYNIDVYPLMCHILGVDPAPNNGSFDRVKSILNDGGVRGGKSPPLRAKLFRNQKFASKKLPPWMEMFVNPNQDQDDDGMMAADRSSGGDYDVRVSKWNLPFSYSVNFDIFVMTLLLIIYVALMVVLSQRIRRARHHRRQQQQHEIDRSMDEEMGVSTKNAPPSVQSTTNSEKCLIIDVVA